MGLKAIAFLLCSSVLNSPLLGPPYEALVNSKERFTVVPSTKFPRINKPVVARA